MNVILTRENFAMYCIKNYNNPSCSGLTDFYNDLKILKYIKRLFKKYHQSGKICDRLLLNHIITFYNVFEINAATNILFSKIDKEYHPILKTFLLYLNYINENGIYGNIDISTVSIDLHLSQRLKDLGKV